MKIPIRFKLTGETINVKFDKSVSYVEDCLGIARYRISEINIQPPAEGTPVPYTKTEHAFFHELVHFILYMMSNDLYNDEKFVNVFARFLHQALTTMEYEEDSKK